ncbi:hypothetical protein [Piscibacillus salipiscarius]|uniref:hypothetical protein n=1 Tax=Piscibacillus salipiscarius TaxID=299480 RepID=UPI0006D21D1E|nr:hypothetical protein [Piscibacillus salipiscarius]
MNEVEVKKIGLKSVFKVTLYLLALPLSIMIIIGLVATVIGISGGNTELIAVFGPMIISPFSSYYFMAY